MNIYEVTIETGRAGYRLCQHVRAVDEASAIEKVQAAQGPDAELGVVTVWRSLAEKDLTQKDRDEVAAYALAKGLSV